MHKNLRYRKFTYEEAKLIDLKKGNTVFFPHWGYTESRDVQMHTDQEFGVKTIQRPAKGTILSFDKKAVTVEMGSGEIVTVQRSCVTTTRSACVELIRGFKGNEEW